MKLLHGAVLFIYLLQHLGRVRKRNPEGLHFQFRHQQYPPVCVRTVRFTTSYTMRTGSPSPFTTLSVLPYYTCFPGRGSLNMPLSCAMASHASGLSLPRFRLMMKSAAVSCARKTRRFPTLSLPESIRTKSRSELTSLALRMRMRQGQEELYRLFVSEYFRKQLSMSSQNHKTDI